MKLISASLVDSFDRQAHSYMNAPDGCAF